MNRTTTVLGCLEKDTLVLPWFFWAFTEAICGALVVPRTIQVPTTVEGPTRPQRARQFGERGQDEGRQETDDGLILFSARLFRAWHFQESAFGAHPAGEGGEGLS